MMFITVEEMIYITGQGMRPCGPKIINVDDISYINDRGTTSASVAKTEIVLRDGLIVNASNTLSWFEEQFRLHNILISP